MVNVKILKRENLSLGFKIEGHVLSGDELMKSGDEYDLICNSISVLSQAIVIGIIDVVCVNVKYEIHDGFFDVNLSNLKKEEIESCQVLLLTFEKSLESLGESIKLSFGNKKYKKYIRIKKEEVK